MELYCQEPFCRSVLNKELEFILVCKPGSYNTLYSWIDEFDHHGAVRTVVYKRWTGKRHKIDTYRTMNAVPLVDADDALVVNG